MLSSWRAWTGCPVFYKALGKNKVNQKGVRMHEEPAALLSGEKMLVHEAETRDERDEMDRIPHGRWPAISV